jgi:hypothetical protein
MISQTYHLQPKKIRGFLVPMSNFKASDFASVKSASRKKKKSSHKGHSMPTKHKKSHAKKRTTATHAPKKRKGAAKRKRSTAMAQYNASGSAPVTYVRGRSMVGNVGAMPSEASFKRAKEAAKKAAIEQTALMTSAATGAAIGYAESQNMLSPLNDVSPAIAGMGGPTVLLGAAAFILSKFTKSKALDGIAHGALTIAAYNAAYAMGKPDNDPPHRIAGDSEEWE